MDSTPRISKISFLVVDDSKFMRTLVRTCLFALGATRVHEAASAGEALIAVSDFRPNIAIVDWNMDATDGLQFVKDIRASRLSPDPFLDIIMLTAFTEVERIREARDVGITEFLAKPFTPQALFARINTLIDKPRNYVRTKTYFGPDRRRHAPTQMGQKERRTKLRVPHVVGAK